MKAVTELYALVKTDAHSEHPEILEVFLTREEAKRAQNTFELSFPWKLFRVEYIPLVPENLYQVD